MGDAIALAVAVPLAGAAASLLAGGHRAVQRPVSIVAVVTQLALGLWMVISTARGEILVAQVGGWPRGVAIPLVADPFAALMLTVGALMVLVCLVFSILAREDVRPSFHPLVLVMSAGLAGAFLTADLFNLFVFIEVILIASYVLLVAGAREQVRAGVVYVLTNLLGSTLLLIGVALVYGIAGTVNLASLASAAPETAGLRVAGGLIVLALAVKASLVPFHGWLPTAYPQASPAVAALFSGLLTKVGVYAMYRVFAVLFGGDAGLRPALLIAASFTMAVGVLGAVGRVRLREILSFHITSQVGYMIVGLGLFGPAGLAAGIFYVLHHIVVKTSLFLSAGAVEEIRGTGALPRLGGLARSDRVLAAAFLVSALSLAGLPPTSGFVAKVLLVRSAFQTSEFAVAAVAIAVSFLTLLSMLKIWDGAFWGEPRATESVAERSRRAEELVPIAGAAVEIAPLGSARRIALAAPAAFLAAGALAIGLGGEGLLTLTGRAADGLVDVGPYVEAVLGR